MKVLVWDNVREKGYVVSERYPQGVRFTGSDYKPVITGITGMWNMTYDTTRGLYVNNAEDTTPATITNVIAYIDAWVQPVGQEGNWTIDQLKSLKKNEMEAVFNEKVKLLVDNTTANELVSWDSQLLEAKAFMADQTMTEAETPILTGMMNARAVDGEWRVALATDIIAEVEAYQASLAFMVGTLQRAHIDLDNAATADDILAVYWNPFH